MNFLLCPDSFKGSLSAAAVCLAMETGLRRVFPHADIVSLPLADGGEGTLDAFLAGGKGTRQTAWVQGPLGEEVEAHWGFLRDGRAVIEVAQAAGLGLVEPKKRDALAASSRGVGQLILAALDAGCREFLVALGGSATTDGGCGALSALGARFFDENDVVLEPGGGALKDLARVDLKFFDSRLQKSKFTLLCDVTNPLCGPNGAAAIYAPQKGASPSEVAILNAGLAKLARESARVLNFDGSEVAGAGAAGGIAFGFLAFAGAEIQSGIAVVLAATDFEACARNADWILTGEGALDAQTLQGKTVAGVCHLAQKNGARVVGFGGKVALDGSQLDALGLHSAFSICDAPRDLDFCLQNAPSLIAASVERAFRLVHPRFRSAQNGT